MNCEKVRIKLSAYMDGEVDAEHYREIAAHLEQCPDCRREREELGGVDMLIRRLSRYDLPSGFANSVASRARDMASPGPGRHFFLRAWQALLDRSEKFLDLLEPEARAGARPLDEFDDIPAAFIGYAYFRLLGSQK